MGEIIIQSTSPKSTLHKSNYRLSRIFLTVPIGSVYFQWYVLLISQICNSNFAYKKRSGIHFRAPRGPNIHVLNHLPQLGFLTDFIRLTFNSCLSAWPTRCHKFHNFFSTFPHALYSHDTCTFSLLFPLSQFPKHTNVYKTVTQIWSKSKWYVRSPEIRLRRSWL